MENLIIPIAVLFCGIGLTLAYYGVPRIPAGTEKTTFIILMIFALVWPFLHFVGIWIWVNFLLKDEHFPIKLCLI
ncbi:hypothetical protein LEP1GSC036_4729 [Leptospira weilii str. 2006001853]|uniref:Uncharacterized protein n=1 Tax=Leptospira weilii str. 2006001853 TaxID=1001589 RepID=A0A828YYC5_9LEPT|nr:hypothetical protein LEP1GSC036_4729 [Leptospira weilii str. 2006001853]EMJ60744.1 hypothetical protein LEP1GSC051_1130 [Leptospira sp. P2653]